MSNNKNWQNFPWRDMNRLLGEMNEIFGDYYHPFSHALQGRTYSAEFPPVNMWSNEEEVVVKAEIPGISPEELGIQSLEDTLIIQGERKCPVIEEDNKTTYHREERPIGKFKRAFKLPFRVEIEKVLAKYENGVLSITLPRSEKEKPKQIKVNFA